MDKVAEKLEVQQQSTHPPEMNFYRIEALRAASRIVAAEYAAGTDHSGDTKYVDEFTIMMAEQFAMWLETGER